MLNTLKILTAVLLISASGCDGVDVNLAEDESAEKNKDDEIGKTCPEIAQLFCVEKEPGIYESLAGTQDAQCQSVAPAGKIVDDTLCEQNYACTEEAKMVCRQLTPGIYMEQGVGRQGPECKFPTDGVVDASFCIGTMELKDLTKAAKANDGKDISVTGKFGDWRNDPIPLCAEPGPFVGTPTLSPNYMSGLQGFGIGEDPLRVKAGFSQDDARTENSDLFENIPEDAIVTLRGVFRYKTVVPVCSNGSVIHPSGTIELELMKK